jgi:hypothetical protein
MPRAVHALLLAGSLLGGLFALACGHEASAPSAAAVRDVDISAPAATPAVTTTQAQLHSTEERAEERSGETCIEVDSELGGKHITLEGRVFVDDSFEHPSRGKTHPYILHLDAPRCAIGIDEARVSELHLASSEGIALKALVGTHVRVSGDPFTAHTAWHARPIVLMATSANPISR